MKVVFYQSGLPDRSHQMNLADTKWIKQKTLVSITVNDGCILINTHFLLEGIHTHVSYLEI